MSVYLVSKGNTVFQGIPISAGTLLEFVDLPEELANNVIDVTDYTFEEIEDERRQMRDIGVMD